jgi:hydroxyacid-oxoacid transhydrogenase
MPGAIRISPTRATRAVNLLRAVQFTHPPSCPCHANPSHHHHASVNQARRALATPIDKSQEKEYAFEMAASSIRFGPGCTKEVGMDFQNMGAKRVMVVTDGNVRKLNAMKQVIQGLEKEGIAYEIYDKVRVEPKDSSIKDAIAFTRPYKPDAFLAVGGGSVIDTAKLMNLYDSFPGMASITRHDTVNMSANSCMQRLTSSTSSTLP